jgi:hypothetical protein
VAGEPNTEIYDTEMTYYHYRETEEFMCQTSPAIIPLKEHEPILLLQN